MVDWRYVIDCTAYIAKKNKIKKMKKEDLRTHSMFYRLFFLSLQKMGKGIMFVKIMYHTLWFESKPCLASIVI